MSKQIKILVADDDDRHRKMLRTILEDWNYAVLEAKDGVEACESFADNARLPNLVLLDVRMPKKNGLDALKEIHASHPDVPIILMTAYSEIAAAVEAMRNGAWDYITKPLDFAKIQSTLQNALTKDAGLTENAENPDLPLLGVSPQMQKVEELIRKVAPSEATLLITGESGTGKELAARAAHALSRRAGGPFVAINCGALPESLLESELFGHEKGAFTGADKAHQGLLRQASGGTIFLDEVGEMPLAMQVKLLRVLQQREVMPVGGKKPMPLDCRIIAATNRNLAKEVEAGNFREDLYYRLNVVNIKMPPLRDRGEDIELLANKFAKRFAKLNQRELMGITQAAMEMLKSWHWPGNVRELENTIERAIVLMPGEYVGLRELPERLRLNAKNSQQPDCAITPLANAGLPEIPTLEEVEKQVVLATLKRFDNNKTEAAKALGITRKTLHAKLKRYAGETN